MNPFRRVLPTWRQLGHLLGHLLVVLVLLALPSCGRPPGSGHAERVDATTAAPTGSRSASPAVLGAGATPGLAAPTTLLPAPAGRFGPAHTALAASPSGTGAMDGRHLAQVDDCADCHPDVAAQWSGSVHAFASFNNPIYRVSIEGFRRRAGARASRFCAGCHDLALLVDGAMDAPADHPAASSMPGAPGTGVPGAPGTGPDDTGPDDAFGPDDLRAHAGITCRMCHGVLSTTADGNGSYTLRPDPIPLPQEGDPASLARHRQAVRRSPLGNDLCMACHRSFLSTDTGNGHHLVGMDDSSDWQASAYTGSGTGRVDDPVPRADCISCHMPREPAPLGDAAARDGTVSSHRFPGGHTWLAAMRGDGAQLAQMQERLRGAISIDIAAAIDRQRGTRTLPADGVPVSESMALDVVLRNRAVGHRFPGGVRDAQDTWIELTVRDARGALVAASGTAHERDAGDTEAHVLRSLVAGADGHILLAREVDTFRAPIVDHTIAARDVTVVRYLLDLPAGVPEPLAVHARLRHRSRNLTLQQAACAEARSARGRAFDRGARQWRGMSLDPCAPQPVTTMAEQRIWIGAGAAAKAGNATNTSPAAPAWQRLYEHGLGWLHAVQERTDEARPSLLAALALLESADEAADTAGRADRVQPPAPAAPPAPDEHARNKAMVVTALGALAGRQGRTDEALGWLDRAEALVPGHAAVSAARGAALTRVWRWHEAIPPLRAAAAKAPLNSRAQALLAMALGSVGEHEQALIAAHRGLALAPRNEALLRVQALAAQALGSPDADAAMAAYARFRTPDPVLEVRFACTAQDPLCAREREPVHEHRLALTPRARGR